ncbi:MAG: D-2-hydroxyacid dehydrogenase [Clostridia bacterium]|nr:D-2-hydroxyacid dehydrogenase [Clostridia bacterium]
MKIVVLDGYVLCPGDLAFTALEALGDVTVYDRTPAEHVIERIADADVVITNKVPITAGIMDACPKMRYIGVTATGYNIVDVAAARERGVTVTNVPAYSTMAVVQHALALLLHAASCVSAYDARVKEGAWVQSSDFCFYDRPMMELMGRTIGIVGYGSIGRAMARVCAALGMDVIVHTAHPSPERVQPGMRFVSLDELLAASDVISLHCPLMAGTKGIIGREAIGRMKRGAMVINTARGPLVDAGAMAEALSGGKVGAYLADVMDTEPPSAQDPLLAAPNTVLTPHVAWAPLETRKRLLDVVVANLRAYLAGQPQNVVS